MANKILHKRNLNSGNIPTTASIDPGELAINVADGKLFLRQSGSAVDQILIVGESSSFAATASYYQETDPIFTTVSGSYTTTSSFNTFTSSIQQQVNNLTAATSSYILISQTSSMTVLSSSFSDTASYLNTLNQDLIFNGNLTLNGTASISYLNVSYESASVIYSSGSNQFGDTTNDVQTLIGQTVLSGSLQLTGSANLPSITGSLLGTASYANTALSASYSSTASWAINAITASFVVTAQTASYVLNAVSSSFSTNALSASYAATASYLLGSIESASYAATASYVNPLHQDVILTGSLLVTQSHISTVDYIDFTIPANPTHQEGRIHWTDDTKTLQVDTDVSNFMIELGHQNVVRVRNTTGGPLNKGTIVYINGESGNRPTVVTASWDGDSTSAATLGWIAETIADNQTGYVITGGIIRGINTTAYLPGTQLYLSSSGNYTSTIPVSPKHEVRLGKTITQTTQGTIYIDIMNGYELGELHDVLITGSSNGDLVIKSGSLWINSKQLTGSYGLTGSLEATSFTGSFLGINNNIHVLNTDQYKLYGSNTSSSIDWNGRFLQSSNAARVVRWNSQLLQDTSEINSIDWATRKLYDTTGIGVLSLDWRLRTAYDFSTSSSINWGIRVAYDSNTSSSINWDSKTLNATGIASVDWNNRWLYDTTGQYAIDWEQRQLRDTSNNTSIDWFNRQAQDSAAVLSIDYGGRTLNDIVGSTSVDWNNRYLTDSVNALTLAWEQRSLLDSSGNNVIYWDKLNNNDRVVTNAYPVNELSLSENLESFTTPAASSTLNYSGEYIAGYTADSSVIDGDLVALHPDGLWYQADQTSPSSSLMLAVCVNANGGAAGKCSVVTEGTVTVTTSSGYTPSVSFVSGTSFIGQPVYMTGSGGYTTDKPTSGYVRVLGHIYYNSTTNPDIWLMKFRPSNDWYVI